MKMENGSKTLENSVVVSNKLNIYLLSYFTPRYVPSRNAYIRSAKCTYKKVHGRTLCKHQQLETTPMSMTVVYSHNRILYHNGNEQTIDTHNVHESHNHHSE